MSRSLWLSIGMIVIVIVASLTMYPALPASMPIHWNLRGEVDGWAAKPWGVSSMPVIMLGLLLLFRALPYLSPKSFTLDTFRSTYDRIALSSLAFCTYLQGVILWAAMHLTFEPATAFMGGACLLLAILGNVLGKVRRNFWVGIRTPWTLASDRVWNATHRLAAKLFVGAGMLGLVAAACGLSPLPMFGVFIGSIMFAALCPAGYSLWLYKSLEKRGELET